MPVLDDSPLANILNRYETHLRSARGLTTATVANYLPFARKFLAERFRKRPLHLRELRSRDVSAFVLRNAHTMGSGTRFGLSHAGGTVPTALATGRCAGTATAKNSYQIDDKGEPVCVIARW